MTATARVLGIDPGLARIGWGVVERPAGESGFQACAYGVIRTGREAAHAERLLAIFEGLREIIEQHRPAVAAIEEVFQSPSPRSAFLAGEGRGACILAAATAGLRVHEYPPPVIKLAVTGNGRAAKQQVQAMVQRLLGLDERPRPHDTADALAIALTHLQRAGGAPRFPAVRGTVHDAGRAAAREAGASGRTRGVARRPTNG